MKDVSSRPRRPRQPSSPTERTVLRIRQEEAEKQLSQRIEVGQEFVRQINDLIASSYKTHSGSPRTPGAPAPRPSAPRPGPGQYKPSDAIKLVYEAQRWHDFNCTWLEVNLGVGASREYKASTFSFRDSDDWFSNDPKNLIQAVVTEITELESVRDRLSLWVHKSEAKISQPTATRVSPKAPIFIVHGSDTIRAESVAHTVTAATGRKTIILRDQPNLGRTLIEKFEHHAAEVSYAIIVLTADDKGSRADEAGTQPRGRQNVIFEMGYFFGLIGRGNVSVLLRPGVEKPSDMDGIAYITFDDGRAWKSELLRELRHAGFGVKL